jgi:hypothetical protein
LSYTYDAEGNRSRKFIDNNSNGVWDGPDTLITAYYYDHRNRLFIMGHHPEFASTPDDIVYYFYDAQNQLIRRQLIGDRW